MITDPIANVLCQIKNGIRANKKSVTFFSSKVIEAILTIFKEEGYISDFLVKRHNNISIAIVYFKYKSGVSVIHDVKRVSKPGYRIYRNARNLPIVMSGMGTAIISTNKEIMSEKKARKLNLGGEVMAYIW